MKKFLLLLLSALFSCCLFAGCDKEDRTVYYFHKLSYEENETDYTFEVGDKYEGEVLTKEYAVLILDGSYAILRWQETFTNENNEKEIETEVTVYQWIEGIEDEIYIYGNSLADGPYAFRCVKDGKELTVYLDEDEDYKYILKK